MLYGTKISHMKSCQGSKRFKGFTNSLGEMNCFLNCALQVLCNLEQMKFSLMSWRPRCPPGHSCLACELKAIIDNYTLPRQVSTLNVDRLRHALAQNYSSQGKFPLFETADSMEALDALMQAIHINETREGLQSIVCNPTCPVHQVAGLDLHEILVCACGNKSEPLEWDKCSFNLNYYVEELLSIEHNPNSYKLIVLSEDELLMNKHHSSVLTCCNQFPRTYLKSLSTHIVYQCNQQSCKIKKSIRKQTLLNRPKVLSFNLVWPNSSPSKTDCLRVLSSLPDVISLDTLFEGSGASRHILKGMIFFSFAHYISMFRERAGKWVKFDDYRVNLIEKAADKFDMYSECLKNHFHPVGVFYEELHTPFPEDYKFSDRDWLTLEQYTLESDSERQEMLQLTAQIDCPQTNVLALPLQKNDVPDTKKCECCGEVSTLDLCDVCAAKYSSSWTCKCGSSNSVDWPICNTCKSAHPENEGWVCNTCTFLNAKELNSCQECCRPKPFEVFQICGFCSTRILPRDQVYCSRCGENQTNERNCRCVESLPLVCEGCRRRMKRCGTCRCLSEATASRCEHCAKIARLRLHPITMRTTSPPKYRSSSYFPNSRGTMN